MQMPEGAQQARVALEPEPAGSLEPDTLLARHRPRRGRTPSPPPTVRIELVMVDGEAGEFLRQRQAAAVRRALFWLRDNEPGGQPGNQMLEPHNQ